MGEMEMQRYGKSERKRSENIQNMSEDNIKMNLTEHIFCGGDVWMGLI
jgi:hypothetical protein